MTRATLAVLPPSRLGELLAAERRGSSRTVAQIAEGSRFTASELAAIEAGDATIDQDRLEAVVVAYGLRPDDLLPDRHEVVVDLDRGELLVAERSAALDPEAPAPDEVLAAYLSLVYALRNAEPGTPLVLRRPDVVVLARALRLAEPDVESRLVGLMEEPSPAVEELHRSLRRRLAVPVIGAAVAVVAVVGIVLVVQRDDEAPTAPAPTTRPGAVESPIDPEVSLLPPVSVTRESPPGAGAPAP
ncbi:MAG: hypothetical protein MUE36_15200 [Acidimicrobiales bacterium]|jgi:transcriptional regulator with XRE-family HTH domain|nr:hypothetical protein [Acidimicrobiales bacterium]